MKIRYLKLDEFEIDNSDYRFNQPVTWDSLDPYYVLLERSLKETGIQSPLLLYKSGEGTLHLIDGFKRVAFSRRFGIETVPCKILSDISLEEILDSILIENFPRIQSTSATRIKFVCFALKTGLNRDTLIQKYLPLLQFESHKSILRNCERVGKLPEEILDFFEEKRFSPKQCNHLSRHPRDLLVTVFSIKNDMAYTASILEEILNNIGDYLRASDKEIANFAQDEEVQAIIHSHLSPQEKTSKFRDLVKRKRYPILTKTNKEIEDIHKQIGLPADILLTWDKTLEKKEVAVSIRVNSLQKWRSATETLDGDNVKRGISSILEKL